MFSKRFAIIIGSLLLLLAGALPTLASDCGFLDGRLTELEFHFGGDALFCDQENGCTLYSATGSELMQWSQAEINAALADLSQTNAVGAAVIIAEGAGTYGPATLFVNGRADGTPQICLAGFDEHGKSNEMCFGRDYVAPTTGRTNCTASQPEPVSVPSCTHLTVGASVEVPSLGLTNHSVVSIDAARGLATVAPIKGFMVEVSCNLVVVVTSTTTSVK
jgi:hypothetical protein